MDSQYSAKRVRQMMLLFTLTYMVSYITRINYGAVIAEMEQSTRFSRSQLSMAVTGSFITYGLGQIVCGILGDRFSPKKLVSIGFVLTICMNLAIPFCGNPYLMLMVWSVNGFAQSFFWPPLVRIMTAVFNDRDYQKATVRVSWGSSFGTIFVYLAAPAAIALLGWRWVFFLSAALGALMLLLWNRKVDAIELTPRASCKVQSAGSVNLFPPVMLCVMLAILLQGMLRDGVTTWMPSYIAETYRLGSEISILTGVVLPLFSVLSFQIASTLYARKFQNPILCAGVIFACGAVAALLLACFPDLHPICSVLLSALLTGSMHGVNLLLVCMVPAYFKKFGNVSTMSGVINSCTYVGSALSTYGIALISERAGWGVTLFIWAGIAVLGTVVALCSAKPWAKRFQ